MINHPIPIFNLDRPEVANALDVATALNLKKQILQASRAHVSGFIIRSRHPRVFCAGGDLSLYRSMKTKQQGIAANKKIRDVLKNFAKAPIFILAAIEGETIGGGCELALACDWIIASHRARFRFAQVTMGLTPGWGGAQRLLQRVTRPVALDWLASGRIIEASEALRCGLIDEVTAPGTTLMRAEAWLREHTPTHRVHLKGIKKVVNQKGVGEEKIFDGLWFNSEHQKRLKRPFDF